MLFQRCGLPWREMRGRVSVDTLLTVDQDRAFIHASNLTLSIDPAGLKQLVAAVGLGSMRAEARARGSASGGQLEVNPLLWRQRGGIPPADVPERGQMVVHNEVVVGATALVLDAASVVRVATPTG